MKQWRLVQEEEGCSLVHFLVKKFQGKFSAKKLKRCVESSFCLVNGTVERFGSRRLRAGDAVLFDESGLERLLPKKFFAEKERILHEEDGFIVYNKPAGQTMEEEGGITSLFPQYLLVHRLDRDTSGLLLLAKNSRIRERFIALFRGFLVKKEYLALADGVFEKSSGTSESSLARLSPEGKQQAVWGSVAASRGKFAKTDWQVVKQGRDAALVRCFPVTGRTHQIRVHMYEMGHPILGDRYGKKFLCLYRAGRCMLHAERLLFPHPESGSEISFATPLPLDFEEAVREVFA